MGQLQREPRRAEDVRSQEYAGDRAARVVAGRSPTTRSRDLHYREDYGTTATDEQYSTLEANRVAFESGVAESRASILDYQGQKDAAQSSLDTSVKTAESERKRVQGILDTAKAGEKKWIDARHGSNFAEIHVWNGWKEEGTYYLPKDYVKQIGDHWQSKGVESGNWGTSGDIWMNMGSKEVHDSLRGKEQEYDAYYTNETAKAKQARIEAQNNLDSTMATWNSRVSTNQSNLDLSQVNLDASTNQLDVYESERAKSLNGIKSAYASRLERIRETVAAMGNIGGSK